MLSAIVILLVVVAGDSRLASDQRGRAQALLDHMTPRRITTAGLFADYTAECSRMFRRFENTNHDIAKSFGEKKYWLDRLTVLFQDGYVLADLHKSGVARRLAPGPADETCTQIVLDQAAAFGTVRYRNRTITLWPDGAMREAKEAHE